MIQTDNAWFFILPVSKLTGCLQIMHLSGNNQNWDTAAKIILEKTGLVLQAEKALPKTTFAAYPRLAKKLFEKNTISISQSLVRYNPIGGDGT